MAEVWLGGRLAVAWELPAVDRAKRCALERDMRVLAGLLTPVPVPRREPSPRTVADLLLEYS